MIARDLLGVAWAGLTAKVTRTVLIMLGPIVGVAAMVGAVGLTESAKGDLKAELSALGTNLITATAGGSFGQQNPTFPADAVRRVKAVPTVEAAAAISELSGVIALPSAGSADHYAAFPVPVQAADLALPSVLEVPMQGGRWLNRADVANHARAVVLGSGLAKEYGYLPGEVRTIRLGETDYGVVGVLDPVKLEPKLDNAVFMTQWAAEHDFGTEGKPTKLYVRAVDGRTQETADALPTAINLGGPDEVSTEVPTDALAASAQADKTLQQTALFAGLLALAVGGLGIANVMSISVIQRSSEIGIRRALGHRRSLVAGQFLLEALFVGVLGGVAGAALGVAL
ncbi:MAG: ABC-type antimicrobial peptide transport system, permease component, partial [Actinomycetia bacterium]|nr:ABC-type antimicrobial peptide transport system, permease component [Actinomycetes bacterium]